MSTSKGTVQKLPNDETDKLEQALEGLRKVHSALGATVKSLNPTKCFIGAGEDILSGWSCALPTFGDSRTNSERCEAICHECEVLSDSAQVWGLLVRAANSLGDSIEDFKSVIGHIEEIVLTAGGRLGD